MQVNAWLSGHVDETDVQYRQVIVTIEIVVPEDQVRAFRQVQPLRTNVALNRWING